MITQNMTTIDKIIENLISIHPLLTKNLNRSIRSKTSLNPGSLFVLGILNKNEMLSMSEIGCRLSMPKPHVTAHIDKLISEEMVERVFDPNDRRIINVKLTENGKKSFQQIKEVISTEMRQNLNKLDNTRLEELLDAAIRVRTILSEIMTENSTNTGSCNKI